jgi:tRNA(fMet)-specific endonuclease VapC
VTPTSSRSGRGSELLPYFIDTNVAIHLRDQDAVIKARLRSLDDVVLLSVISRVELEGGVYSDPSRSQRRRAMLDLMLATMPVVPFADVAAAAYGRILAAVGFSRRKVIDRMIAAQALVHQAAVVTMNPNDFNDVPHLRVIAW